MKKIVLYGAGKRGQGIYKFLKGKGYEKDIYGFCDKKAKELIDIDGKKVWLPKELVEDDVLYCLTLLDEEKRRKIENELGEENCIDFSDLPALLNEDRVEFNRDFCAFYHIEDMDSYFKQAEKDIDFFGVRIVISSNCFRILTFRML